MDKVAPVQKVAPLYGSLCLPNYASGLTVLKGQVHSSCLDYNKILQVGGGQSGTWRVSRERCQNCSLGDNSEVHWFRRANKPYQMDTGAADSNFVSVAEKSKSDYFAL